MPESRSRAISRAKRLGFPVSNVVKGDNGYYIAPRGISEKGKHAYADLRSKGYSKESAARIAHSID